MGRLGWSVFLFAGFLFLFANSFRSVQQAQTYFAGQSRYVGVYDTSRMAARAYVVVQDHLRMYRGNRSLTKDSPKEELARIFATARKAADEAVAELRKSEETTTSKKTTKVEVEVTGNDTDAANT